MIILIKYLIVGAIVYWLIKSLKKHMLGISNPEHQHTQHEQHTNSTHKNPYEILGVQKTATKQEIKKAYREALSQYHPDKVNHLGADIKKLAQEKTQQIQWAYERLNK